MNKLEREEMVKYVKELNTYIILALFFIVYAVGTLIFMIFEIFMEFILEIKRRMFKIFKKNTLKICWIHQNWDKWKEYKDKRRRNCYICYRCINFYSFRNFFGIISRSKRKMFKSFKGKTCKKTSERKRTFGWRRLWNYRRNEHLKRRPEGPFFI